MKVIKRDGSIVDYDRSKISTAIQKANDEVPERTASVRTASTPSLTALKN